MIPIHLGDVMKKGSRLHQGEIELLAPMVQGLGEEKGDAMHFPTVLHYMGGYPQAAQKPKTFFPVRNSHAGRIIASTPEIGQ